MNNKKLNQFKNIVMFILCLVVIFVYIIFQIKFVSYVTILLISIFTFIIDILYFRDYKKNSKLLLLLSLISTLLFSSYLYLGIHANEPSNIGDFSILPIILFIISFPFIVITHLMIIYKLFLKKYSDGT